MSNSLKTKKYCFDSDALISSWRLHYRPTIVKELWDRIGKKITEGSILIPKEVRKEIGSGKDELVIWLKQYKTHIIPITIEQIGIVSDIVNKYPLVSRYNKPRPYHADPFVVAVARIHNCTVVTYEGLNRSPSHPKVPDLCKEYDVNYCSMSDFFEKEGWKFNFK